jgi:hypothetical protein
MGTAVNRTSATLSSLRPRRVARRPHDGGLVGERIAAEGLAWCHRAVGGQGKRMRVKNSAGYFPGTAPVFRRPRRIIPADRVVPVARRWLRVHFWSDIAWVAEPSSRLGLAVGKDSHAFVKIIYDAGAACGSGSSTCIWGQYTVVEELQNDLFGEYGGRIKFINKLTGPGLGK